MSSRINAVPGSRSAGRSLACAVAVAAVIAGAAQAQQAVHEMEGVTVYGVPQSAPIGTGTDSGATVYQISGEGLAQFAGPGATNPYAAIADLPSVNAPALDPYGMANVPGGNKGLRVRGELATHGGAGTVEGLPLSGIDPGPGYQWLFDMENFASVSLAEGPIAPDRTALFTTSGALDSRLLWPLQQRGLRAAQSFGSFGFHRSYLRLDSGTMGGGSAMFLSASDTGAYKWRGPGRAPDGRRNVEAGIESHPLERLQCRLYAAYDYMKQDDYRPLTYAQAGDLGVYREYDFAPVSSDAPAEAVNYYGYNRQVFADWALLSELRYEFSQETRFVLKPYYERERGAYLDGQASGKVRDWLIAHDSYGLSAELQSRLAGTDLKLGYWWSVLQPPGPPTAWKMYKPDASGGMSFAMWSILAKVETRSQFHNLYLLADHRFDALDLQGGVRVVRETLPGLTEYATMGVGDLSYEEALSASSGPIAARSVGAFSVYQALPFLALDWRLAPRALLKLAAGRNYGAPSFDLWPVYQMNAAGFAARNLSADALWHGIRPETADAVDLGLRLGEADSYLEPTLFYSSNRHKSVAYDPGIGIAYSQNVAHTRAYGAQLAGAWKPLAALSLFGTLSWDRNVFAGDLPRLDGTALAVSGLQLPDTPQWLASAGAEWRWRGLRLAPRMHYSGARYGDTQQTQRLGGYTVVDLDLGYERKLPFGRFDASLSFINLFDRDYIGFINASYYQLLSSSSAIYYPGAPFTVVGRVALNF